MNDSNHALIERDEQIIPMCTRSAYFSLVAKEANGVIVEDFEGRQYIDMISSASVVNTGYNHPTVLQAVQDQLAKYIHFSNDYFYTKPQIELAEALTKITPGDFTKKVIFGFSGSDSVDSAIKVARAYTGRSKIISFVGAYHGSTYGAISVSAIDLNMKRKIGPLLPDVFHLEYPNKFEMTETETEKAFSERKFLEFKKHFEVYIPPEEVALIIIEPIAGDLGLLPCPQHFMQLLRQFCDQHGILLAVDEIQQGFGRTGKWFSIENFAVVPDLVIMGKAMASGFPMSAVVGKSEAFDAIGMPGQLFTLQGNAVCASAALATIDVIKAEKLLDRAVSVGDYVKKRFKQIAEKSSIVYDIRGYGLSIGVELKDKNGMTSATEIAKKICYRCFEKGLILIYMGGNTLRVQPPLVISAQEIERAMDKIEATFLEYEKGEIADDVLTKITGW